MQLFYEKYMINSSRLMVNSWSSTFSGNREMIDFLCWENMDSQYILFLLINGKVKRIISLLEDECSTLSGKHKFFCFGSSDEVLNHQEQWEPINSFVISSYEIVANAM